MSRRLTWRLRACTLRAPKLYISSYAATAGPLFFMVKVAVSKPTSSAMLSSSHSTSVSTANARTTPAHHSASTDLQPAKLALSTRCWYKRLMMKAENSAHSWLCFQWAFQSFARAALAGPAAVEARRTRCRKLMRAARGREMVMPRRAPYGTGCHLIASIR